MRRGLEIEIDQTAAAVLFAPALQQQAVGCSGGGAGFNAADTVAAEMAEVTAQAAPGGEQAHAAVAEIADRHRLDLAAAG